LGGLPTRCGEFVVRPRCLFRSSAPARFDAAERVALDSLGLRTAIDLRTSAEVVRAGDDSFGAGAGVVRLPLFNRTRRSWIRPADQSPLGTAARYLEMTEDGRRTIGAVVARLARADATPAVIYCSAGRDRTGIVVACILDLLDVAESAIAADYALSDGFDPAGGRAHAATIVEWLGLVRERYGSVRGMLSRSGVTEGVVEAVRKRLLVAA
jgi:protein-tyrosine phosphatase